MTIPEILQPETFAAAQQAQLESEIQVYPARAWYPSGVGHPCDRHLVWRWTRWDKGKPHEATLQSIFEEGRLHQPSVYKRLRKMGFDFVQESDRPRQWKIGNGAVISGRIDGKLTGYQGSKFVPALIMEIKSSAGHTWDALNTIEDVKRHASYYVRGYADQGNLYCLLEEVPAGVLIFKNKSTGLLKPIFYELDYESAERMLKRIERLQQAVQEQTDPPPISYEETVCGDCPFGALCYPPRAFGEGASMIEDPAFETLLEQREMRARQLAEMDGAQKEFSRLDGQVKAYLKRQGIAQAIAGEFEIEGKQREIKSYTVPARTDTLYTIRLIEFHALGPNAGSRKLTQKAQPPDASAGRVPEGA